jgi:hypothetical protein
MTRDTVDGETPALRATSLMVTDNSCTSCAKNAQSFSLITGIHFALIVQKLPEKVKAKPRNPAVSTGGGQTKDMPERIAGGIG